MKGIFSKPISISLLFARGSLYKDVYDDSSLVSVSKTSGKVGTGLVNSALNKLGEKGIELHVPKYKFLGPGTRLAERLARNDTPLNPLDTAAREHDIFYSKYPDLKDRHIADKILQHKAWKRVTSRDAKLSERVIAALTSAAVRWL